MGSAASAAATCADTRAGWREALWTCVITPTRVVAITCLSEEEEEEEEEEGLFRANAVNEEDPERDRATQV